VGFRNLVVANSELILEAPVITVAWVRSFMAGADFEFACHCAMMWSKGAPFSRSMETRQIVRALCVAGA